MLNKHIKISVADFLLMPSKVENRTVVVVIAIANNYVVTMSTSCDVLGEGIAEFSINSSGNSVVRPWLGFSNRNPLD